MKKIRFNDFPTEIKIHGKEYKKALTKTLSSGTFILGDAVKNFEKEFAAYLQIKYCIGVANGLEAIQIALLSLGIGKGDEVITTPVSAVATTLAIIAVGAKPIFVDTTEDGLLNPNLIPHAISKKTKAIIPVHLYGNNSYVGKLQKICKKYKLYLIEDACQAHGSTYNKLKLGTIGDIGCFSFYPTKNLGAFGDGGAIVTNNHKVAQIAYQLRDYGQESKYVHKRIGLNSRLDEMHAELLRVKLKYLDKYNAKRFTFAKRYIDNLTGSGVVIVNAEKIVGSNLHLFVIKTKRRDALKEFLEKNGVPTAIHYPLTIPDQPFYDKKRLTIPVARAFVSEILSLPCHPYMDLNQVDFISKKIIEFFKIERKKSPTTLQIFNNIPIELEEIARTYKKQTYQAINISYTNAAKAKHAERYCSEKDRFKFVLAFENKEVVGGLTLLKRKIFFQKKELQLGGIAGVWVKKDRQGYGIGTLLLRKAIGILKKNYCQVAYLQIDKQSLAKFYEKFGFELLKTSHTYFGKSGKRYYGRNGMIAPLNSQEIFKEIIQDKNPFFIGKGNW